VTKGYSSLQRPKNIFRADNRYAGISDCASYALANTDVWCDREMAHDLGRLRKNESATFYSGGEWDVMRERGVFDFLNRFVKVGNEHDVSKSRALYLVPEFTNEDLQ